MNKEIDMTFVEMSQRKHNAKLYSTTIAQRKKHCKVDNIIFTIITSVLCITVYGGLMFDLFGISVFAKQPTEQKYIARYGTVAEISDNGDMLIETEDGNLWTITDAPEYDENTELRVLFDSKGTVDATDDVIIDITER